MQKFSPDGQSEPASRAGVTWPEPAAPFSERFQDFYYSKEDGLAETREVFVAGNDLPGRWKEAQDFSIAELGFGTGLNFLETWRSWRQHKPPGAALVYTSFEAYPMQPEEMCQALAAWPDLAMLTRELISNWPSEPGAVIELKLDPRMTLRVIVGDALAGLGSWHGRADAWYLDGFVPARNPEMWSGDLMREVFVHTARGGSFSTYTSAGWVRRNLEEAGFTVERVPGFGRKRHRLQGYAPD